MFTVTPQSTEFNIETQKTDVFFSVVFERNTAPKIYTTQPLADFSTREEAQKQADIWNKGAVTKDPSK
jgi:hypothetical protein